MVVVLQTCKRAGNVLFQAVAAWVHAQNTEKDFYVVRNQPMTGVLAPFATDKLAFSQIDDLEETWRRRGITNTATKQVTNL